MAKSGVSVLKLAQKSKALPNWLSTYLSEEAKIIRKSKDISSLKPIFSTLNNLYTTLGMRQTLKVLSHTRSLKELQSLSNISKRYGAKTANLLKLSDKQVLTHERELETMDIKTIELASSYGISGFVHLFKGGEKSFIKMTKRMKSYSKVGYKGEIWKMFLWIMKYISNSLFLLIIAIASLLLLPKKRVQSLFRFRNLAKLPA